MAKSVMSNQNKRKSRENVFTAKVESGTLKVKIMRQDERMMDNVMDTLTTSCTTKSRQYVRQLQLKSDAPLKPRPNRKHVPIFYEPQFRQPIKRRSGNRSSINAALGSDLTSSTTALTSLEIASQLPDGKLQSTSSSVMDLDAVSKSLFVCRDNDRLETLSGRSQSYLPSPRSSGLHRLSLGGNAQQIGTMLSTELPVDNNIELKSALHQLASSSALYQSALDELSKGARVQPSALSSFDEVAAGINTSASSATATTMLAKTSTTNHELTRASLENCRLDSLSTLQTAIDHAPRVSSVKESANQQNDKHFEVEDGSSNTHNYSLERSSVCGTTPSNGNTLTAANPKAVPETSSSFIVQNSRVGGGIQCSTQLKLSVNVGGDKTFAASGDSTKDTVVTLGTPPDVTPALLVHNSLTGGGISVLNFSRKHAGLDTPGSLTCSASQANEMSKNLNSTLTIQPKTYLYLDKQVSVTSVASEDSGIGNSINLTGSCLPASPFDICIASSDTTQDTVSNETIDLGPPPSDPPAFTIGNSLMGGGIESQPAVANVNTHSFDWKLHRAVSTAGEDATSSS